MSTAIGRVVTGNPLLGWDYKDTISYGKGFTGLQAGSGKSLTQAVGNASESDMESGAINDSLESGEEVNKKSGAEEMQKEKMRNLINYLQINKY